MIHARLNNTKEPTASSNRIATALNFPPGAFTLSLLRSRPLNVSPLPNPSRELSTRKLQSPYETYKILAATWDFVQCPNFAPGLARKQPYRRTTRSARLFEKGNSRRRLETARKAVEGCNSSARVPCRFDNGAGRCGGTRYVTAFAGRLYGVQQ